MCSIAGGCQSLIKIVTQNLEEAAKQDLNTPIFERSQAEVMRLTDIDKLLKDFEKEYDEKLKDLKKKFDKEKDLDKKADMQIDIAQFILASTTNNILFHYDNNYYASQIAETRSINCILLSYLRHMIYKKYFDMELIGANTFQHIFAILPRVDGSYLIIDEKIEILTDRNGQVLTKLDLFNFKTNYKPTWNADGALFSTGNFEQIIKSAILNNIAVDTLLLYYTYNSLLPGSLVLI